MNKEIILTYGEANGYGYFFLHDEGFGGGDGSAIGYIDGSGHGCGHAQGAGNGDGWKDGLI